MNLNQNDLVKYGVIAVAGLAALGWLNSQGEKAKPVPKAMPAIGGYSGPSDFSGGYYGEEDDDDDYYSYQGDDEDDYDYYGYAGETGTTGTHPPPPTGGGGMHPGDHPGPGGHPGPITPHTDGHEGGWKGFHIGPRFFDFRRYHVTNPIWNWFRRYPYHGAFPTTPQLGFPYFNQSYPFMTNPSMCYRFPWSMMPQCRRRRFPQRRPWNWNRRPGFPGHPGMPGGHPGMPGPHPDPHPGPH